MEGAITAAIGAAAAIGGAVIAGLLSRRTQELSGQNILNIEREKIEAASLMHSRTERMQGLQKIYQAICDVSREFCMTRVFATLESGISAQEFDQIYFREAEKVDTIRFLALVYAGDVSDDLDLLYAAMNRYWGAVRALLDSTTSQPDSRLRIEALTAIQNDIQSLDAAATRALQKIRP